MLQLALWFLQGGGDGRKWWCVLVPTAPQSIFLCLHCRAAHCTCVYRNVLQRTMRRTYFKPSAVQNYKPFDRIISVNFFNFFCYGRRVASDAAGLFCDVKRFSYKHLVTFVKILLPTKCAIFQSTCRTHPYILTCLLNAAQSFFRSQLFLCYLRNTLHFMETKNSSPCSQQPDTCFYPLPYQTSRYPIAFHFKFKLNIIL